MKPNAQPSNCSVPPRSPVWWLVTRKGPGAMSATVLTRTWFDARAKGALFFGCEPGDVEAEMVKEAT